MALLNMRLNTAGDYINITVVLMLSNFLQCVIPQTLKFQYHNGSQISFSIAISYTILCLCEGVCSDIFSVQFCSMVKKSLTIKWTYFPLCTYFCAAFASSLIISDKLCSCLLSSDHFTCTLWLFNRPDLKLLLLLFFPLAYLSQLLKYSFTCSFIFFFQAVWVLFFSLGNYLFSCSGSIYQAWIPGWLEWWTATNSLHNVCFHDTCTIRSANPELHSIQFQSQDRLKVPFLPDF